MWLPRKVEILENMGSVSVSVQKSNIFIFICCNFDVKFLDYDTVYNTFWSSHYRPILTLQFNKNKIKGSKRF